MTRLLLTAVILFASAPTCVSAQDDEVDVQEARARFQEGERAYERGEHRAALEAFTEAHRLMEGHPNQGMILFNIGRMHEELGHPSAAREAYRRFLAEAPEGAPNRTVALERIAILDARTEAEPDVAEEASSPESDGRTGTSTSHTEGQTMRTEGHWANWIVAGALVAVAVPAIAVPMWTVASEGECPVGVEGRGEVEGGQGREGCVSAGLAEGFE